MTVSFRSVSLPPPCDLDAAEQDGTTGPDAAVPQEDARRHRLAPPDTDSAAPGKAAPRPDGSTWRIVGIAAAAGVLAALAVALAERFAIPPPRPEAARLEQVAHATSDLTDALQVQREKVRALENESVAATEATAQLDGRLKAERSDLATAQAMLARLAADLTVNGGQSGLSVAALFGVAVAQLRDAINAGRRFDWELVNVRGIVPDTPDLLSALDRLAPMAGGVPTEEQLASSLSTLMQIEAPRGSEIPLVGRGIELVGRILGPTLGRPVAPDPELLARAAALLGRGDLAGSLVLLRSVDGDLAVAVRPLVAAAEKRADALAAVRILLDAARDRLSAQLKVAAGRVAAVR